MYPNTDRAMALKVAQRCLDSPEFQCFRRYSDWNWRQLLEVAHQYLEFEFDGKLFEQVKGVPIGSPAGPQLAILSLHKFMSWRWEVLSSDMIYGGVYFDDLFIIFHPGVDKGSAISKVNGLLTGSTLNFDEESFVYRTLEELQTQPLPFLDVSIRSEYTDEGWKMVVKPYSKPQSIHQYAPWRSAHPPSTKRGIVRGELIRRLRLTDRLGDWLTTVNDLKQILINRGYPTRVIQEEVDRIDFKEAPMLREMLYQKVVHRRVLAKFPFTADPVNPQAEPTIPMVIRYDPTALREVKRLRRELEENINQDLEIHGRNIKRIRVVTAHKVGRKLGLELKKKKVQDLNPEPNLESHDLSVSAISQNHPGLSSQ